MSARSKLPDNVSAALELVAPGTEIREAIENIIRARNGALLVLADLTTLEEQRLVYGGFELGCDFAALRVYELSKMDGAIVVSPDLSTILYAGAQLAPDPTVPSAETGMRHLAAHRTARQSGALALAVSERRGTVTLYLGTHRPWVLDPVRVVLDKADSALVTLEKFTRRLREQARLLSIHEHEGTVSLSEVVSVLETFEQTVRISAEIRDYLTELGTEGGLIELQLDQAAHWIPNQHEGLLRDYVSEKVSYEEARSRLRELEAAPLPDASTLARAIGYSRSDLLDALPLSPRGYRQLSHIPRLPTGDQRRIVEHFGSLDALMRASEGELRRLRGVGRTRARAIKRGLQRSKELALPAEFS
jgi:diadenylate cyclase